MPGFKDFAVGEVLTAGDVNTFLMQQAVAIETVTGGAGDPLQFSSINQIFRHLLIIGTIAHDDASGSSVHRSLQLTFNGDNSTGSYDSLGLNTETSGTSVTSQTDVNFGDIGRVSTIQSAIQIFVPAFSVTGTAKTARANGSSMNGTNPGSWIMTDYQHRWAGGGSAIDSVELWAGGGDEFTSDTRLTLFGLF